MAKRPNIVLLIQKRRYNANLRAFSCHILKLRIDFTLVKPSPSPDRREGIGLTILY